MVPVSTFAREPFEIVTPFSVVVRPDDGSFTATLFDANIASSGDTPEEAVANLEDLIVMVFDDFESKADEMLGSMMLRQKIALESLVRRV